jgi:hypothetical protein
MIKQNKLATNINEYGIEILFDSTEKINNSKILLGGLDDDKVLNYDDILLVNNFHNIIFNLF